MNTHAVAPPRELSVTSRLRTPALLANDAPMASAPRSRLAHNWACVGLVLAMSLATVVAQQRVSPTAQSEMEGVIRRFYELRARTLDERGTAQDVTDLMALLAASASERDADKDSGERGDHGSPERGPQRPDHDPQDLDGIQRRDRRTHAAVRRARHQGYARRVGL